ncbi:MAG: radical SAM protein, partial [Planctomycetota bacterium]|nr:radical SAM protein [Planctomycetota bacterium]
YKMKKFRVRPLDEIKEDIAMAAAAYGPIVRTVFLPDGNTIFMRTAQLVDICGALNRAFPGLERITTYGAAKFLVLKTADELRQLREAGLRRIHAGLESGDDVTLAKIKKGATAAEAIEAGRRVKEAGFELSEYILVGIGGRDRWREHAVESACVLNAIQPDFVRLRTYVPVPNAPIYKDYETGEFQLPSPHEAIREVRSMIENLTCRTLLLSDHISNYVNVEGQLPRDKEKMLKRLDAALATDESKFAAACPDCL